MNLSGVDRWFTDQFDAIANNGRWQLFLVVVTYFIITYLTLRMLITAPVRYQLLQQIDEQRADLALRPEWNNPGSKPINDLLTEAERRVSLKWPKLFPPKRHNLVFITFSKVMAGLRYVHAATRLRVVRASRGELSGYAEIAVARLNQIGAPEASAFAQSLGSARTALDSATRPHEAEAREARLRTLTIEAFQIIASAESTRLEHAAESQRRTVWLSCVGLMVVLIIGLLGRRTLLLFGALGGFLAPLTTIWQRAEPSQSVTDKYTTSWGLLLLSPVAGALAAISGLLLLRFLADPDINVMGEVFRKSWDSPRSSIAIALALVFGFSGQLFSKVALAAASQGTPPTLGGASLAPQPVDPPAPIPSS